MLIKSIRKANKYCGGEERKIKKRKVKKFEFSLNYCFFSQRLMKSLEQSVLRMEEKKNREKGRPKIKMKNRNSEKNVLFMRFYFENFTKGIFAI